MCKIGEMLPFFPECPLSAVARAATSSCSHQVDSGSLLLTTPLLTLSDKDRSLGPHVTLQLQQVHCRLHRVRRLSHLVTAVVERVDQSLLGPWRSFICVSVRGLRELIGESNPRLGPCSKRSTHRQHAVSMLCLSSETVFDGRHNIKLSYYF